MRGQQTQTVLIPLIHESEGRDKMENNGRQSTTRKGENIVVDVDIEELQPLKDTK